MNSPTRDQLCEIYLAQLPYPPYRVQEDALLAWFTSPEGVLVCAPTGTGKTLIAHAALYEALKTGAQAYYTTPLIALTEQKYHELKKVVVGWGFPEESVGLVTGNRRVNPQAPILVVVAEILLNRLLNPTAFDFSCVSAVVVDEFHSFSDPERGIVWELTLSLLPKTVRLLLLSATVGNAHEFLGWLANSHGRKVELVQENQRKVPLTYHWVADKFLGEQMESMAEGPDQKTPALVFCFNREECWTVAEQLKGLSLLTADQKKALSKEVEKLKWTQGAGPKIRTLIQRGVGVHHAGLLPKYRRVIEDFYERKLLAVCVCTETLAAGINLPARSVVLSTILKGPPGKKKPIDASSAHQIFGRAGRPQFDTFGFVYVLAHEDDVRIARWQEKYNAIPENTKDLGLMKARKELWRKRPTRRENEQYWTEPQFRKLVLAPPANLYSKGPLPWRLLAYLLRKSPEVERIRAVIRKRLLDPPRIEAQLKVLDSMLGTLRDTGFVQLEPPPPKAGEALPVASDQAPPPAPAKPGWLDAARMSAPGKPTGKPTTNAESAPPPRYSPRLAHPTEKLDQMLAFRSVHPLYAVFLLDHLGLADRNERIQLFESVLELPRPLLRHVRVPFEDELPQGPLATERLNSELITRGLMLAALPPSDGDDEEWEEEEDEDAPPRSLPVADKARLLFDATHLGVTDVHTTAVWAAGELLRFNGDFNKYIRTRDIVKQEGLIFRHVLRMILLLAEFSTVTPTGVDPNSWRSDLREIAEKLTAACRGVDPESTEKTMRQSLGADLIAGEAHANTKATPAETSADAIKTPLAVLGAIHPADLEDAAPGDDAWRQQWASSWDDMLAELQIEPANSPTGQSAPS